MSKQTPSPRLDLVAHIREQLARDPEAYANPSKLEVALGILLERELRQTK